MTADGSIFRARIAISPARRTARPRDAHMWWMPAIWTTLGRPWSSGHRHKCATRRVVSGQACPPAWCSSASTHASLACCAAFACSLSLSHNAREPLTAVLVVLTLDIEACVRRWLRRSPPLCWQYGPCPAADPPQVNVRGVCGESRPVREGVLLRPLHPFPGRCRRARTGS